MKLTYNFSITTKSTNELIAGFVFLAFRMWSTVTSDEKTKALLDLLGGSGIVIHQMKALGALVDFKKN